MLFPDFGQYLLKHGKRRFYLLRFDADLLSTQRKNAVVNFRASISGTRYHGELITEQSVDEVSSLLKSKKPLAIIGEVSLELEEDFFGSYSVINGAIGPVANISFGNVIPFRSSSTYEACRCD